MGVKQIFRIYFLLRWFNLSDPRAEVAKLCLKSAERGQNGVSMRRYALFSVKSGHRIVRSLSTHVAGRELR